jgi:hypothetical protein
MDKEEMIRDGDRFGDNKGGRGRGRGRGMRERGNK